jgi:drug/metabolite transporter (DMT)-like permease
MKKQQLGEIGLVSSALFFGVSGVLTQVALTEISPMLLIFYRFILAGIIALVVFKINIVKLSKETWSHGLILSTFLIVIYVASTYGLKYTSASNAAFITGSSVMLIPILNRLFFGKKIKAKDSIGALICLVGLSLVTLKGAEPINKGDLFCFINAIAYASYIIYSSRMSKDIEVGKISGLQYVLVALGSGIYLLFNESISINMSMDVIFSLILLGVFCTFLSFLVQITSQRFVVAERAGKILTLIPVFAVLFDYLVYGKVMSLEATIGGSLILMVIVFDEQILKVFTKNKMLFENN